MSIIDQILGRTNKAPVSVPTPEWNGCDGKLAVRRLSPTERVEFYVAAGNQKATAGAAFQAFTAAYCTVQEDGSRAFADDDWKALASDPGSGSAVERLSEAADELNILSDRTRDQLKKNSAIVHGSEVILESPGTSESP